MRQHVRPANLVTSGSLAAGFLALTALPGQLAVAAGLVLAAAAFDVLDGVLARRAGGDHTFGAQLDSLADLLCFCVVPAVALHHVVPSGGRALGVATGCVVVLAGAWRLARFPLVQTQGHFIGLPTPAAGGLVMLLALWAPPGVALLGALVLSALMVSSVRVPSALAAAASVRPGRRAQALRQRLTHRPVLVPRVLRRVRRPRSSSGTGSERQSARAAHVRGALRRTVDRRRRARP